MLQQMVHLLHRGQVLLHAFQVRAQSLIQVFDLAVLRAYLLAAPLDISLLLPHVVDPLLGFGELLAQLVTLGGGAALRLDGLPELLLQELE